MRVLVCDDDPMVRSLIAGLVVDQGHTVVGEVDDELGALEFVRRAQPDIAVIDLALRSSTGLGVVEAAWESGCGVIVFSSHLTPELLNGAPGGPVGVEKPHFDQLELALERVANAKARDRDRRARPRPERPPGPDFARAVAAATPGDAIVILEPPASDRSQLEVVGLAAARTLAGHDRFEVTSRHLRLFLVVAGEAGARAVIDRLTATAGVDLASWAARIAVVRDDLPGPDAYDAVRATSPLV